MRDLWDELPVLAQDILIAAGLLVPLVLIGAVLLRGFRPLPLVGALMWRFRWANLMFVLLIAVSTGMGIGLIAQERGLRVGTARAAEKFDLVVSAPGSELTMMMASVFLQPSAVPLLDGAAFDRIANHERVDIAAPIAFGDSYDGAPVVGTIADFVTHLSDGQIDGRIFARSGEAVVGAAIDLEIGDRFTPAHGRGDAVEHGAHDGFEIEVVGRMARSGSPWDRAILIPVETVWEVHGLANGHPFEDGDKIGPPYDPALFPGTPAVLVRATELWANYALRSEFTEAGETMAFFPGTVLANLYRVMGDVRQAMSIMSVVTQVLVAASVLLGLFILSRLFQRQLAMLRALGAPRRFVMAVVWSYGVSLLVAGTLLGLAFGFAAAAVLSRIVTERTDILVTASITWSEVNLALAFLSATSLLSLVPALVVLTRPIVENLRQ
ncbi:FtsX-like permease family protein [Mameliella sediminis]|uniref:FtsX-like permease family protein n=1 Tax=Mameliella sediminis TaxID=2836866 RepID=UPI001C46996D|nr:FtsX-like permease family protein [Mameliella sediminis]MBV7395498.1 FtsX-like permease family protein [Mameliella sediminis]MBY6114201.1 FtsX-like permease family protein [Antarctobacter heliothermus]MBY6142451.1 FtsX-like permease family protein [Mameliella alba]MCA0953824.1 FtsX-like permease family protein [Mameliella alba]